MRRLFSSLADSGINARFYYSAAAISASLAQWRLQPGPLGANYPFGNP